MKKSDVQDALLDEFAAAEKRRERARSDTSKAQAVGAKKVIAKLHMDLFGFDLSASDEQRSKSR